MNSQIVGKSWVLPVMHIIAIVLNSIAIATMKTAPDGYSHVLPSFTTTQWPGPQTPGPHSDTTSAALGGCTCFQYIADMVAECSNHGDAVFDCDFSAPTFWVA